MDRMDILRKANSLSTKNNIIYFDLGKVEYNRAFGLQKDLFSLVQEKDCLGFLLLLQHPPVITIGSNRSLENLISGNKVLSKKKIDLVQSTRGGDITFHGPGQLVAYPIINLSRFGKDLSRYVYNLEQVIINTLNHFNIKGVRIEGHRGVFIGNKKIASIGIKIKKWTTMHGLALNVDTDLRYFKHIIACGLKQYHPTSMQKILNTEVSFYYVKERLLAEFKKIFTGL